MGKRHGGGRTGDAGHVVMLGQPQALVAEPLDMAREVQRIVEGLARIAADGDGRKVED